MKLITEKKICLSSNDIREVICDAINKEFKTNVKPDQLMFTPSPLDKSVLGSCWVKISE